MTLASVFLRKTWLYTLTGKMARWIVPKLPRFLVYSRLNEWGKHRELPEFPKRSFRELYRKKYGGRK